MIICPWFVREALGLFAGAALPDPGFADDLPRDGGCRRRGCRQPTQATSVFTAAVSSVRAVLASAKNIEVFGSTYSSLSMPA